MVLFLFLNSIGVGGAEKKKICSFIGVTCFRGEDTRNNFTSYLYAALCRSKIETFIDNYEVRKGYEISSTFSNAI
ncbi:hypothetical protein Dsin_015311 [Dipteronia sinensis]|uniref:TIR domain-containing protein n=1 Tax=Dipteronia sinensis TaxID=43782 RepID=A0AAE0E4W9_9ROSI|nr:hypothetical protein Dsin_015311 [Dipteronia sinensis]